MFKLTDRQKIASFDITSELKQGFHDLHHQTQYFRNLNIYSYVDLSEYENCIFYNCQFYGGINYTINNNTCNMFLNCYSNGTWIDNRYVSPFIWDLFSILKFGYSNELLTINFV